MGLTAVQEIPNLEIIDIKFSVVGHSAIECNSIHSAITTEQRIVGKVNWPANWKTIAKNVHRRGHKLYNIYDMVHNDFVDWKGHPNRHMIIRKHDSIYLKVISNKCVG